MDELGNPSQETEKGSRPGTADIEGAYATQLMEESGLLLDPGEEDLLPKAPHEEIAESSDPQPVLITQDPNQEREWSQEHTTNEIIENSESNEDAESKPIEGKIEEDEQKSTKSLSENESNRNDDSQAEDEEIESEEELDPYEARAREIQTLLEDDSLWDTDLEEEADPQEQEALHDTTGKFEYYRLCEKLNVVPVKYFVHHIQDTNLVMRYHGLGAEGAKAIARVMQANITVEIMDLSGNWMDAEGGEAIGKMIEENGYIQKLIISDNQFRWDGIISICKSIPLNGNIQHLNLSGNELGDQACEYLANMIENSKILTELVLSHNGIGSDGAEILGPAFYSNDVLERVDLSWNSIRGNGAVVLARSLKENIRIKWCNLSWNGFGKEGGKALADMIRDNSSIQMLDISGNRLDSEVAAHLGKSLVVNEAITHLYMGNNPINTTGVLHFIGPLEKCESSACVFLSLEDIPVEYEFIKTVDNMTTKRPEFQCIYGPELRIGNTEEDIKKEAVNLKNPIILLRQHYIVNDFRLVGVLQRLDTESTMSVTPGQFIEALNELGIPFKKSHIDDVRKRLNRNGDGNIYYGDFVPPEGPRRESGLMDL